ncbi:MAG: hypothetical protein KC549_04825, partial [Myxococcales bacterium]|nr:hypothetical protein [Myxococcales bacterium]
TRTAPFVPEGEQNFGSTAGVDDNAGRARFCSERENEEMVQGMVVAPIVPDNSVGRVPIRNEDGTPTHADQLVGRPEDGKFCDPTVYSNALTWGPVDEVIAFIDTETRLLTDLVAYSQYLGNMNCSFPDVDAEGMAVDVPVTIKLRERVRIGDQELDQYTSRAEQGNKPTAWLNNDNINRMYRAVRHTFFQETVDPAYDCVATKICNTFYQSEEAQEVRQSTQLYFIDSEVVMAFSAEGQVEFVLISPVRIAPFEIRSSFAFGREGSDVYAPTFTSLAKAGCNIDLSRTTTWAQFKRDCVGAEDQRTLDRVGYNVYAQRDGVSVEFNGVDIEFQRKISENPVYADGERPLDSDELTGMTFTRSLNAPVAEFVPKTLAWNYRIRLRERLRAAVHVPQADEGAGTGDPMDPPVDPMDPPVDPEDPPVDPMDPPV